jgi:hypothetical protein
MPTLINSFSLSSTVGIGTNTPNKNLTVIGEVSASRNLFVGGDLNVYGTVYTYGSSVLLSSTNLEVGDPMIYIANNNTATNNPFDIGIVGHFNDSTSVPAGIGFQHTGFVRNRLTGNWTLFSGVTTEPSDNNTINWSDPKFKIDTINANLSGGSFITTNLTAINIFGIADESVFTDGSDSDGNGSGTLTLNYLSGVYVNSPVNITGTVTARSGNYTNIGIFGLATQFLSSVASVSASLLSGTYMAFPSVGIAGQTDTCLLRQIGGNDTHTLSFDMFDNPNSATDGQGFAIRTIPTAASAGTQFALSSIQTDFFVDATSGNIGIGTASPNRTLTVVGDISATGATSVQSLSSRFINLEHPTPNDGTNPALFIGERGDGSGGTAVGSLSGFNTIYDEINNRLIISTQFGVSPSLTAVTITSAGNIGIGTATPNRTLTVVGDISATGSLVAGSNWNNQTTNYVIQDSDCGGIIALSSGGVTALSASIPNNNFRAGYQTSITRLGTGTVRISAAPGVSLRQAYNLTFLSAQYSVATLTYSGNPTVGWLLFGDLA